MNMTSHLTACYDALARSGMSTRTAAGLAVAGEEWKATLIYTGIYVSSGNPETGAFSGFFRTLLVGLVEPEYSGHMSLFSYGFRQSLA
jgi:hypothetical protein